MTDPQNPSPWSNPDNAQTPYTGPYQNVGATHGAYEVHAVNNMGFPMPPLAPVLPQELAPPRPATITAAMWIWIAGAVLSVALVPMMLLINIDFLLDQDSTIRTREDRQAAEFGVRAVALVSGFGMLVASAPYVAFAIVLRNGHNWARILLTILGVLGMIAMAVALIIVVDAQAWQAGVAICIVVMGLTVAAVVLQFLPASNKFVR